MINFIVSNRVCHKRYVQEISEKTGSEIIYIEGKNQLTLETLEYYRPRYIFFPHWSYLIPAEIYEQYECVVFHMTDLPYGRGGSPLQNLVSRGLYQTKISALRCVRDLDAGDIYMKRDFSLYGAAEEIYIRAGEIIKEMIIEMIQKRPAPQAQSGEIVSFKRRRPEESNISMLQDLLQVFDYIRMLDADGYPKAFLETEYLRLEFTRASLKDGYIKADVEIRTKECKNEKSSAGSSGASG